MIDPTLFFVEIIVLTILGPMPFHVHFRESLSMSKKKKKQLWGFDRNCIYTADHFGEIDVFARLRGPIYDSFHFFRSSLISFISTLYFQLTYSVHVLLSFAKTLIPTISLLWFRYIIIFI